MNKWIFIITSLFLNSLSAYQVTNHTDYELYIGIQLKDGNHETLDEYFLLVKPKESVEKITDFKSAHLFCYLIEINGNDTFSILKDHQCEKLNTTTIDIVYDSSLLTNCDITISTPNTSFLHKYFPSFF